LKIDVHDDADCIVPSWHAAMTGRQDAALRIGVTGRGAKCDIGVFRVVRT
jgi:hypothetical protein